MNMRVFLFTFSGLILCFFQFSLAEELAPQVETINVAHLCEDNNSTVNLGHLNNAILKATEYWSLDCDILLGNSLRKSIVISFSRYDLDEDDKLVIRDSDGTELSLAGRHWFGEKTFIFKGPVTIHYVTNSTFFSTEMVKFMFVFTVTHDSKCGFNEFECRNRQCISKYLVCDRQNNCGDGSDEIDCNHGCTANEFSCANTKCIPKYKLCNGNNDCGDMSDEAGCNRDCETLQQYKCNNSKCISHFKVCDDYNDCGDWSDETNCYRPCDINKYRCFNRKCIDYWKVCNGHDDCGDRSDERNCRACYSYEFRCTNGKCVSKTFVCNNRDDCGDFSDEKGCRSVTNWTDDGGIGIQSRQMKLPIILSSVAIGIVLIVLLTLSICFCVTVAKRKNTSSLGVQQPSSADVQQPAPSSLIGRMRQSFRSHGQPSAPPLEMASESESGPHEWERAPSIMGRIRQSFRSRHQPTVQPAGTTTAPDVKSENPKRPAIYPNLPAGTDNPEFKAEE